MKRLYTLLVAVIFIGILFGCEQNKIVYPAGGFAYPKSIEPKDSNFFMYPYKDSLTPYDSIKAVNYGQDFFSNYNEPNLSIGPQDQVTFRLIYEEWGDIPVVISLKEDKIIIKQTVRGRALAYDDPEKLTEREQEQLHRSEKYLQLDEQKKAKYARYYDSLLTIYPEMKDVTYYKKLLNRTMTFDTVSFQYSEKIIPISKKVFFYLVNLINNSGYWSFPRVSNCDNIPTDGGGFFLEANTPTKYKIVMSANCPNDERKFTKACDEIVKQAKMEKKIQLIWDSGIRTADSSVSGK